MVTVLIGQQAVLVEMRGLSGYVIYSEVSTCGSPLNSRGFQRLASAPTPTPAPTPIPTPALTPATRITMEDNRALEGDCSNPGSEHHLPSSSPDTAVPVRSSSLVTGQNKMPTSRAGKRGGGY